jgi:hypothetical protein
MSPFIVKDIQSASEIDKGGEAVEGIATPMVAGSIASSLAQALPRVGGALGKVPYATLATVGLNFDEAKQEFNEHPLRAVFNYAGADIAGYMGMRAREAAFNKKKTTNSRVSEELPVDKEVNIPKQAEDAVDVPPEATTPSYVNEGEGVAEAVNKDVNSATKPKYENLTQEAFADRNPDVINRTNKRLSDYEWETQENRGSLEHTEDVGAYGHKLIPDTENMWKDMVSIEDIWSTANEILPAHATYTGIKSDKLTGNSNTLGYFLPQWGSIKVKGFRSFSVLAHEVGHAISNRTGWGRPIEVRQELRKGALSHWTHEQYGNPNDPNTFATYTEEGRALFMTVWSYSPAQAAQDFPQAYSTFVKALKDNPDLGKKVEKLGQQIRRWANSTSEQKGVGAIHFADSDIGKEKSSIEKKLNNVYRATIDDLNPLRLFKESIEKDRGNLEKIAFEDDPYVKAVRARESIPASINALLGNTELPTKTLIDNIGDKYDASLYKVTFRDILQRVAKTDEAYLREHGLTNKNALYKAFSSYCTAMHTLDVIKVQNARRVQELNTKLKKIKAEIDKLNTFMEERKDLVGTVDAATTKAALNSFEKALEVLFNTKSELENQIDRIKSGKDDYLTAIPRKDAENIVKNAPNTFIEAQEKLTLYNSNLLTLLKKGGIISPEVYRIFRKTYPNYVPMSRSFALDTGEMHYSTGKEAGYVNMTTFLKRLSDVGSERTIEDPLVAMQMRTQQVINLIERNRVAQSIIKLAKDTDWGHKYVEHILLDIENPIPTESQASFAKANEHIVYVYEGGKRKSYRINDKNLYSAMTMPDYTVQNALLKFFDVIAKPAANTLRIGATSTPAFALANLIRDTVSAVVLNPLGRKTNIPIIDPLLLILDGVKTRMDKNKWALFQTEGVQYSGLIGSEMNTFDNNARITKGLKPSLLTRGFNKLREVSEITEQIPRAALFSRALDEGKSAAEAAYIASDGTVNFMRHGASTGIWRRWVPFSNATLQGSDKFFRALTENPLGTSLAFFSQIALPSVALWYINKDKDWYQDVPLASKNKYWFMDLSPAQDGSCVITLPKPELVGYMGSVIERLFDYAWMHDDSKELLKTSIEDTIGLLMPSFMPTAALPLLENMTNYSFFRAKPIVDARHEKALPADQYNEYTSEIAKGIGGALDVSPMKIDNAFYGYTGSLGRLFLNASDTVLRDNQRPSKKWQEQTRFAYAPNGGSTRTSDIFYDTFNKMEAEHASSQIHGAKSKASKELLGMRKANAAVKVFDRQIREVQGKQDLTGDQKRAQIDALRLKRNLVQRKANQKYAGFKYIKAPTKD